MPASGEGDGRVVFCSAKWQSECCPKPQTDVQRHRCHGSSLQTYGKGMNSILVLSLRLSFIVLFLFFSKTSEYLKRFSFVAWYILGIYSFFFLMTEKSQTFKKPILWTTLCWTVMWATWCPNSSDPCLAAAQGSGILPAHAWSCSTTCRRPELRHCPVSLSWRPPWLGRTWTCNGICIYSKRVSSLDFNFLM